MYEECLDALKNFLKEKGYPDARPSSAQSPVEGFPYWTFEVPIEGAAYTFRVDENRSVEDRSPVHLEAKTGTDR